MHTLRRSLLVTPRVLNEAEGLVEFVASDSSIDSYQEIVRHDGWRFTRFSKNAPFVDSHDYSTIEKLLGAVVDWRIERSQLIETVKYARQPDRLAEWAFRMVRDGFLKAVSVGFVPLRMVDKWSSSPVELAAALSDLKLSSEEAARVRAVYLQQEQIELSQCVIGANPNALARAYKAGTLSEADLDQFCALRASHTGTREDSAAESRIASQRSKLALLAQIQAQL